MTISLTTTDADFTAALSSTVRDFSVVLQVSPNDVIKSTGKRGSVQVTYEAINATLTSGADIKFLPNPNYSMKKEARADAWKFCC